MVHKVILDVIASMLVLPNRLLVKLDAANDYFRTYQHHLGVLRLSVVQATGIKGDRKGGLGHLLDKVMKDIPDCYCRVNVGAEKDVWQTKTLMNTRDPAWNETHDFLVMDHDQYIGVEVLDKDFAGDDNIGVAMTPVRQLLLAAGGTEELALAHDGKPTDVKLKLSAKWYEFVPTTASLSSSPAALEEDKAISGRIAGLVTVLVASVHGLKGDRAELHPSVKVNWGAKHEFRTAVQSYSQGVDIFNPSFDTAFRIPITAADLASPASFRLTLMNRDVETGSIEVTFADMLSAPGMTKEDTFAVGTGGSTVRASIWLRGTELAK
jgi:Ca2+-dependent lipid-binding protein